MTRSDFENQIDHVRSERATSALVRLAEAVEEMGIPAGPVSLSDQTRRRVAEALYVARLRVGVGGLPDAESRAEILQRIASQCWADAQVLIEADPQSPEFGPEADALRPASSPLSADRPPTEEPALRDEAGGGF